LSFPDSVYHKQHEKKYKPKKSYRSKDSTTVNKKIAPNIITKHLLMKKKSTDNDTTPNAIILSGTKKVCYTSIQR